MAEFTSDGRAPVELDPEDVKYSLKRNRVNKEHVAHVDPQYSGIVSHLYFREKDGALLHGTRLIDGNHRAARFDRRGV